MALNATNTHHRTVKDEPADIQLLADNYCNEAWKDWPNEAGFVGLKEHRGPVALHVIGSIPAWAAGALYRNGPGVSAVENTSMGTHHVSHWFDGLAHMHRFDIVAPITEGGTTTVSYSSRRQSADFVDSIKKRGWRAGITFGQRSDPCVGLFAKAMSLFAPSQVNANVAVYSNLPGLTSKAPAGSGHRTGSKSVFLTTDQPHFQDIDPDTLEPLGITDQSRLHPDLKGPLSSAHAQRDQNGDMFNYNLQLGRLAKYRVFRVNASTGTTDILATISEPAISPAYIHSLFLSENYVILCIPSSHYGWSGAKIPWERNLVEAIKPFSKSNLCKWVVVDRRHGKGVVARFSTPAGFFFHSINAFEEYVLEDGIKRTDLSMDYIHFDTTDIVKGFYYDIILDRNDAAKAYWLKDKAYEGLNPRLVRQRFRMPLREQTDAEAAEATAEEVLSIPNPHAGELPTINPAYACKSYRYVFSTGNRGLNTIPDSLIKTDLSTRDAHLWCGPQGHSPGEPIFVPRPGATQEDDGIVLSLVLDGSAQISYLLCLDAKTMTEIGRAEASFPIAIGLHGIHAPAVDGGAAPSI